MSRVDYFDMNPLEQEAYSGLTAAMRLSPDPLNEDTFADMIAYAAIAGECRENKVADDLRPMVEEG